jgi:phosphoribosylglycinamide formyltransferase 1
MYFCAMINAAVFASGEGTNAENLFKFFEKYKKNVQIISKESMEKYTHQFIEFLKVEKIDLVILAGFLLKLPVEFVKAFPNRIINIHPSLLPKYGGKGMYGNRVHSAVLENKEKESGITIHLVNEEYDEGEILVQEKCEVLQDDTIETLAQKIQKLEHEHFPKAIEKFL